MKMFRKQTKGYNKVVRIYIKSHVEEKGIVNFRIFCLLVDTPFFMNSMPIPHWHFKLNRSHPYRPLTPTFLTMPAML